MVRITKRVYVKAGVIRKGDSARFRVPRRVSVTFDI